MRTQRLLGARSFKFLGVWVLSGPTPYPNKVLDPARQNLTKLLACTTGLSNQQWIDTQLMGANVILLSRHQPVTKETSGRSTSYGFNFEAVSTYTSPRIRKRAKSPPYDRLSTYVLFGLRARWSSMPSKSWQA